MNGFLICSMTEIVRQKQIEHIDTVSQYLQKLIEADIQCKFRSK